MKETETTYYCDVTGEQIENQFDMLEVEVDRGGRRHQLQSPTKTLHISQEAYSNIDIDVPLSDIDVTVLVSANDTVVGCKIIESNRIHYVGYDDDTPFSSLIPIVKDALTDE